MATPRPLVLTTGLADPIAFGDGLAVAVVTPGGAIEELRADETSVFVIGPLVSPEEVRSILRRVRALDRRRPSCVVTGPIPGSLMQECLDDEAVIFASSTALAHEHVTALVRGALGLPAMSALLDAPAARPSSPEALLGLMARLAQLSELPEATALVAEAIADTVHPDGARCVLYERYAHRLVWRGPTGNAVRVRAASGLVGYAAVTGQSLAIASWADDSRHHIDVDGRRGNAHGAVAPMVGVDGEVIAVVAVWRASAMFTPVECACVHQLVQAAAPMLSALLLQQRLRAQLIGESLPLAGNPDVFREEAVAEAGSSATPTGRLLVTHPTWLRRAPWLLLALIAASAGVLAAIDLPTYASGPAVIRQRDSELPAGSLELVAFLPAAAESSLRRGLPIVLRVDGHQDVPRTTAVDAIGPVLWHRADVARYGSDFLPVSGPVVVVRASLPTATGQSERPLAYRPGMTAAVDIAVRSGPALASLLRPLRGVATR